MLSPDHNEQLNVALSVQRLQKSYGGQLVVDNITFDVHSGEIFGLLGPNGAGKTTTIECIEGLRQADDGWIEVLGLDPRSSRDQGQLRERTGVQLQSTTLPSRIRVGEAVNLFRSLRDMETSWSAPWSVPWKTPACTTGLFKRNSRTWSKSF